MDIIITKCIILQNKILLEIFKTIQIVILTVVLLQLLSNLRVSNEISVLAEKPMYGLLFPIPIIVVGDRKSRTHWQRGGVGTQRAYL